jgi:hypothetical protein
MFKKMILALVPVVMLASNVLADDDLLSELANTKGGNIADASIEVDEFQFDVDVDALADNAGEETGEDAVEACFRRFGYRSWGYRHGYNCFRPVYNCYTYYRPLLCRPIYHTYRYTYSYCAPVVSHYWGCY